MPPELTQTLLLPLQVGAQSHSPLLSALCLLVLILPSLPWIVRGIIRLIELIDVKHSVLHLGGTSILSKAEGLKWTN